ncbi:hypothetical protein [Nonomuraea sp. NPDC049158]|uniref:hypothetical protein n=1 Tax=Nonomuraea sp. NPDC049158 TaxID=3155649 RepID=UPI0033C54508
MRAENRDGLAHALQVMTEHFGELRFLLGSVLDGFDRLIGWQVSQGALLRAGTQTAQQQLAELTLISDMIAWLPQSGPAPVRTLRSSVAGPLRLPVSGAWPGKRGTIRVRLQLSGPESVMSETISDRTPSAIIVTPSAHSEQEVRRPHPLLDFCATVSQVV